MSNYSEVWRKFKRECKAKGIFVDESKLNCDGELCKDGCGDCYGKYLNILGFIAVLYIGVNHEIIIFDLLSNQEKPSIFLGWRYTSKDHYKNDKSMVWLYSVIKEIVQKVGGCTIRYRSQNKKLILKFTNLDNNS